METGLLILFAILIVMGVGLMMVPLFHLFFHVQPEELKKTYTVLEQDLGVREQKSNKKMYLVIYWVSFALCIISVCVKYYMSNSENDLNQMEVKVK